jgi:type II secretory pathway component PulF
MYHYRCIISDSEGKRFEILKDATNERELILSLHSAGHYVISYNEIEESELYKVKKRFNKNTVLDFTNIMAALLQSGLTVQDALELCKSISVNSKTSLLCQSILEGLNRGTPFHEILKIYSSSFSPLYRALIRLGEKTGSVADVFFRMGSYLQANKKIRGKLGNVLWYPFLILFIAIFGCFGIIFYVMPRMEEIFLSFNVGGGMEAGFELTNIYRSLWISLGLCIVTVTAVLTAFILYRMSSSFAYSLDTALLSIPLIGPFIKSLQTLDFSFAMEMLIKSGITVTNALKESAAVVSNHAYRAALMDVYEKLLHGEMLSGAFLEHKAFPEYIGTWIAVGEKTGSVETVFTQIRTFFQNDVEHGSERLMSMIEPALTLFIGIVVLALIIQFVLPVFSLYGRIL